MPLLVYASFGFWHLVFFGIWRFWHLALLACDAFGMVLLAWHFWLLALLVLLAFGPCGIRHFVVNLAIGIFAPGRFTNLLAFGIVSIATLIILHFKHWHFEHLALLAFGNLEI